jgi:hypothetical protein
MKRHWLFSCLRGAACRFAISRWRSPARPRWLLAVVCVAGCGYVGDPLPPALNIPERVRELRATQVGDRLIVEFSMPERTTEALPLRPPVVAEVRVAGEVQRVESNRADLPATKWAGQTVEIAARAVARDKSSEWSDPLRIDVVAPLPTPAELRAESHPRGVRLAWTGETRPGLQWRVSRGKDELATAAAPEYIDATAEYGKSYEYSVQAVLGAAVSERAGPVKITPEDKFAPEVPAGLAAVPGVNTIELTWEPVAAADLKGYRVYRNGELLTEVDAPAFSDRKVETSRAYAYSVSSMDLRGNESARSTPVEITAP